MTPGRSPSTLVRRLALGAACSLSLGLASCADELPTAVDAPVGEALTAPSKPTGFTATAVSEDVIGLSWGEVGTADEYRIDRSVYEYDSDTIYDWVWRPWVPLATPVPPATTLADSTVTTYTRYRYRIKACNAFGCSKGAVVELIAGLIPAAPTGFAVDSIAANRVWLVWNDDSTNEEGFYITRREYDPGTRTWGSWVFVYQQDPDLTSFSDGSVLQNVRYEYRIRACTQAGCSKPMTVTAVTEFRPTAPHSAEIVPQYIGRVYVNFDASPNASASGFRSSSIGCTTGSPGATGWTANGRTSITTPTTPISPTWTTSSRSLLRTRR